MRYVTEMEKELLGEGFRQLALKGELLYHTKEERLYEFYIKAGVLKLSVPGPHYRISRDFRGSRIRLSALLAPTGGPQETLWWSGFWTSVRALSRPALINLFSSLNIGVLTNVCIIIIIIIMVMHVTEIAWTTCNVM